MNAESLDVARFRTICEESPVGIFLCDENGQDVYSNPANLAQMGLSLEAALGDGWQHAIHPDDRDAVFARFNAAIEAGEIYKGENRYLRGDESIVWVSVQISAIRKQGAVLGFVGVAEDITSRKRLETELQRAQVMRSIGQMAGGLAHDFNNLLVAILGHVKIATNSLADTETVRESLATISAAGEQAAVLTRQLLSIARQDSAKPRRIHLATELPRLGQLLTAAIPEDVDLLFNIDSSLPAILIDPVHLQRLVINLLLNAGNAIDGRGEITVRATCAESAMNRWKCNAADANDQFVELSVTDTGRGMDENTRSHIFEPFFTTGEGSGTGLGLSTCYAMVKNAGGFIDVDSDLDRGATFRVLLPATPEEAGKQPAREPAATPTHAGTTILLVDDDPAVLESLAILLRQLRYNVVEANSFEHGLQLGADESKHIDLIISDINLGDGSGLKLWQQLSTTRAKIPMLLMSGRPLDNLPSNDVELGGVSFVDKPCPIEVLVDQIERVMVEGVGARADSADT